MPKVPPLLKLLAETPYPAGLDWSDTATLWDVIYASFEGHRFAVNPPDPDAQAALDRIAAKCLKIPRRPFNADNCDVREQMFTVDELRQIKRHHDRIAPSMNFKPIVALAFEGRLFVVEGNTRLNKWLQDHPATPRRAIVITPTTPSSTC